MNEQNWIENKLIIITKETIESMLAQENPADVMSLYVFYYFTAKWQETNQPRVLDTYAKTKLHWGSDRLKKAKTTLSNIGLITTITKRTKEGKIKGTYIKLNYIFTKDTTTQIVHNTQMPETVEPTIGKQPTYALSDTQKNALSEINKDALSGLVSNDTSNSKELTKPTTSLKEDIENKELNKLVSATFIKWKDVNHKWENWYKQKPQQEALKRLFTNLGVNQTKLNWILNKLKILSQTKFISDVTTPWKLENNYASVLSQISKIVNPNNKSQVRGISSAIKIKK